MCWTLEVLSACGSYPPGLLRDLTAGLPASPKPRHPLFRTVQSSASLAKPRSPAISLPLPHTSPCTGLCRGTLVPLPGHLGLQCQNQPKSSMKSPQKVLLQPGARSPRRSKQSLHGRLGMLALTSTSSSVCKCLGAGVRSCLPTVLQAPKPAPSTWDARHGWNRTQAQAKARCREGPAGPQQATPSGPGPGRRVGCGNLGRGGTAFVHTPSRILPRGHKHSDVRRHPG